MVVHNALDYAAKGFPVLPTHGLMGDYCTCGKHKSDPKPCKAGKHPASEHGYKDATTNAETIRAWWVDKPWANVAITTHGGRFFVLECDVKHGGDETIAKFFTEHGAMPPTPTARSGGGGTHWYFRYPVGATIKSRSDVAQGVDVRGDSGYVLAPPSNHVSGGHYTWITDLSTPLADAPDWVLGLVTEPTAAKRPSHTETSTTPMSFAFVDEEPCDFASHPGAEAGKRNNALMRLLGIHLDRGDSMKTIEASAMAWASRCDPPIPSADIYKRIAWAEAKRDEADDLPPERDGVISFPNPPEGINSTAGGVSPGELIPSFPTSATQNAPGVSPVANQTPQSISTLSENGNGVTGTGTETETENGYGNTEIRNSYPETIRIVLR